MPLRKIPEQFKKYDDTKTLIVKGGYIPSDYKKPFAIPGRPIANGLLEKGYEIVLEKHYIPYINGKKQFAKVLVQRVQLLWQVMFYVEQSAINLLFKAIIEGSGA